MLPSVRSQKNLVLILRFLAILGFISQISGAATSPDPINLAWDSNLESDIAGYRVHYGTASGTFSSMIEVGTLPEATLSGLEAGTTYFCAVQAFNTAGLTSGLSSEISFSIPEIQRSKISVGRISGSGTTLVTEGVSVGDVELGSTSITETFVIQNLGTADLEGLSITTSDEEFEVAFHDRSSLVSGGRFIFQLRFKPSAAGLRSTVLRITSADSELPPQEIVLSGKGIATPKLVLEDLDGKPLSLETPAISFGSIRVGSSGTLVTYVLRNTGSSVLTGLRAVLGNNDSNFVLHASPVSSLEPGAATHITVGFTPTRGGVEAGSLWITFDSISQETLALDLLGNGIAAPEISVIQNSRTDLSSGTSVANFGSYAVGSTSGSQTFTIKNLGSAPLTNLSVSCDDADFNLGSLGTSALPPGASTTFKVSFQPTSANLHAARLVIYSNDADESRFSITLAAKGYDTPEIGIEQGGESLRDGSAFINFGTLETGSNGRGRLFTIRNSGRAKLENLALILNGLHPDDFLVTPLQTRSLAPGASTTFKISFAPTRAGTRWAAIHIASNDGDERFFDIVLTGNAAREASSSPAGMGAQAASKVAPPARGIEVSGGRKYRTLTIAKTPGTAALASKVEVSSNLVSWSSGKSHTTVLVDNAEILKVRDNTPLGANSKRYIRLKPATHR